MAILVLRFDASQQQQIGIILQWFILARILMEDYFTNTFQYDSCQICHFTVKLLFDRLTCQIIYNCFVLHTKWY